AFQGLCERDRSGDLGRVARVAPRGVLSARLERLDALAAAAVGNVHELLLSRARREIRVEHCVDRVPPCKLDTGALAFGREDEPREDVVVARVTGEQRTSPDVVEIRREDDGLGVDLRGTPTPGSDQGFGDGADDPAVRL